MIFSQNSDEHVYGYVCVFVFNRISMRFKANQVVLRNVDNINY